MKTQPILDSVLEHLTTRFPDVSVELFPDNVADYFLTHANGAVLISYQSSRFSDSQDVFWVNQKRDIQLALTIISRSQWGDYGALDMLDQAREAVVGFEAVNCKKATVLSEQFLDEVGGLWQYQMIVNLPTQNIQHSNAEKI